jgi:hypothetical protein
VARVFITGSSDGLGLMAARVLIEQGHEIVAHGRNDGRSRDALEAAAGARAAVTGDLSTIAGARTVADQVNKLGRFDAVIHNAGARDAAGGNGAWSSQHIRGQCARALHSDSADRTARQTGLCQFRHAPRRATRYGRSALDQASLERLFGLRREQALRCFARLCRRSPLERRQIQCAGAWVGSNKDGRPLSTGRSSSGVRNPGLACYERGRGGAIDGWVFLSSAPSCAERDRKRRQDSGGAPRGVPSDLWRAS